MNAFGKGLPMAKIQGHTLAFKCMVEQKYDNRTGETTCYFGDNKQAVTLDGNKVEVTKIVFKRDGTYTTE